IGNYFITDVDGTNTVTVSGAIENLTSSENDIGIMLFVDGVGEAGLVFVPYDATNYSMVTLACGSSTCGYVEGFIDVDESREQYTSGNETYRDDASDLDLQGDLSNVDLRFVPPVELISPADKVVVATTAPAFSWEDYSVTAGAGAPSGAFPYAFFFNPTSSSGGFPENIWAVPSTTT